MKLVRDKARSTIALFGAIWVLLVQLWTTPAIAAISTSERDAAVHLLNLGIQATEEGNYPIAIDRFTSAIDRDSQLIEAYADRCLVYLTIDRLPDAIADCDRAVKLSPANVEANLNLGLARYRSGDFSGAIADFDRTIALAPEDVRAYYNRGLAKLAIADYTTAVADFDRALAAGLALDDLQLTEMYADRGLAYLMLENWSAAIADLKQAIAFDPINVRAYYNRACAYHRSGNNRDAIMDFSRVLQLQPDRAEAYANRGSIYFQIGQRQAAIQDLRAAAQVFFQQGAMMEYQQMLDSIEQVQLSGLAIG